MIIDVWRIVDMSQNRIAVFIDWANAFRNVNIDVAKFRQFLETLGSLSVVYAYMVDFSSLQKENDPEEAKRSPTGFWKSLERGGIRIRRRAVKVIKNPGKKDYHKANWDIGIAIDILETARSPRIDEVVLFSGDSDFEDLIVKIQEPPYLFRVTVVSSGRRTAWELRDCADRYIDLDLHLPEFSTPYEKRSRREIVEEATTAAAEKAKLEGRLEGIRLLLREEPDNDELRQQEREVIAQLSDGQKEPKSTEVAEPVSGIPELD